MADNIRVIDCRVDELAANMNELKDPYAAMTWDFYDRGEVRRVTVVLTRLQPAPVMLPTGFDPHKMRHN